MYRVLQFNPHELRVKNKRVIVIESNERGRVDILRPNQIYLFGQDIAGVGIGNEFIMWERVKSGVI